MPAFGSLREARGVEDRGKADPAARAYDREALAHEGAIQPLQRHDIGNGRERHEIEALEKVRLTTARPETAHAKLAVERHEREEHDAGRAEMAEAGEVVLPVWVDDRPRRG